MLLEGFDFNTVNFERMMTDTNGPLAEILVRTAETVVVAAQETVGRDWYGEHKATNPPPGPPYRRTGDLQQSIHATPPFIEGVVTVDVVADAVHRGFAYPHWLLQQGYLFVDLQALSA